MATNIIVVDQRDHWLAEVPEAQVIDADEYIRDPRFVDLRRARVYNLCRSYRYQTTGYYVSLLAEARGHTPFPSIATTQDLKFHSLARSFSARLQKEIDQSLAALKSDSFVLSVYFGRNLAKRHDRLARKLAEIFPAPLLRGKFVRKDGLWRLQAISAITTADVPGDHWTFVGDAARQFFRRPQPAQKRSAPRFTLAILVDPEEPFAPSNAMGLKRFAAAAEKYRIRSECITREDYSRLPHFDGLFIRATTSVNHFTYRFARSAEAHRLVVIDDSSSIVRCTNKVFLAELLRKERIAMPKTAILHRGNLEQTMEELGFPIILKLPDSSFSQGVLKAEDETAFLNLSEQMLKESELLIAQEYLRTDFDWRIGVLDNKLYYACQYRMARGHWQIYNNATVSKGYREGGFECVPLELVPSAVRQTALKATEGIGNGLYGVDLKQIGNKAVVIEINDNPNLDGGVEDRLQGTQLWERLAEVFLQRIEAR